MADISKYIDDIEKSPSGYFARKPIIKALTEINEVGGDADSLDEYRSDELLTHEEFFSDVYLDEKPTFESRNAVKSSGIYKMFGDVRKIDMYEPLEKPYDEEDEDDVEGE